MKMTQGVYSLKNFNKLCMKLSHSTTLLSQVQHVKDTIVKKKKLYVNIGNTEYN